MIGNRSSYDKKKKYVDEHKKYVFQKSSARKFCEFFIIKHHEMIGTRSSYDK